MTNADIFVQILSEASGKPKNEVQSLVDILYRKLGNRFRLDEEVPDDKANELLGKLRNQLPGIRRWLIEGGLMMEADIARAKGQEH